MKRKRFDEVDVVKAIGIIGVILIHVLTYSLTSPLNKFLWNYTQFVVIAFVFCSGFVLSSFYKFESVTQILSWYKKRILRLLIPFYIYLLVHYGLWVTFPNFFQGLGLKKSLSYFADSVLLFGGTNFNWLPLLFIQLTLIFPLLTKIIGKRLYLIIYLIFSIGMSILFLLSKFPYSEYRLVMWVPWSAVFLIATYFSIQEKKDKNSTETLRRYLLFAGASLAVFVSLCFYNSVSKNSLIFYSHKYPPDIYYLSFGLMLTFIVLVIGKTRLWQKQALKKMYGFVSRNSYQLFLVHYVILDFVLTIRNKVDILKNPYLDFVIILSSSILVCALFQKMSFYLKSRKASYPEA